MILMDENNSPSFIYSIPKEVNERIPDYFYQAFAGELFAVFGYKTAMRMFEQCDKGVIDLCAGSSGWLMAFEMTCAKLNMMWLYNYRHELEWDSASIFDLRIESRIAERFAEVDSDSAGDYYMYLSTIM